MRGAIQKYKRYSTGLVTHLSLTLLGLVLVITNVQASLLTFNGEQRQGVAGVEGLDGIVTVVQSPDGKQVYVTALGTNGGLTTFNRDTNTGKLLFNQTVKLSEKLINLAFSPDAKHLYATTLLNKIVVLERNTASGVVVQKSAISNVPGLVNNFLITVSGDGKHVYVISRNTSGVDVLAVFGRDATTGELTSITQYFDNLGDIRGLAKASAMVLSPDGKNMYVSSSSAHSISVFDRDAATGFITFVEQLSASTPGIQGLAGASDAHVSADGKQVYVTSAVDNALVVFNRELVTGRLFFVEVHDIAKNATLAGARSIGLGHDGTYIYVTATLSDAINIYRRDKLTGKLTLIEAIVANAELSGLEGVDSLSVSADGSSLYVAPLAGAIISAFQVSKITLPNGVPPEIIPPGAGASDPVPSADSPADNNTTRGGETSDPAAVKVNPATTSEESTQQKRGGGGAINLIALSVLLIFAMAFKLARRSSSTKL